MVSALGLQAHALLKGKSKSGIVRWFAQEICDMLQEPNTATSTAAPVAEADADETILPDIQGRMHCSKQVVDSAFASRTLSAHVVGSACNIRGVSPQGD